MTTRLKSITFKGLVHDVDTMVSFETDLNPEEKINWTATIDHLARQLSLMGMQRIKTANGAGMRQVKEKTGANGGHPLDLLPWPGHKCENCDAPLGIAKIAAFKGGPNKGKPGWVAKHMDGYKTHDDCKPIFLSESEYVI